MRSRWKLFFVNPSLLSLANRVSNNTHGAMRVLRVFSRSSTILDQFVGLRFEVYNGKTFKTLKISKEMVGYKFGEFVFTKKLGSSIHKKKITKRQQKKSKNK